MALQKSKIRFLGFTVAEHGAIRGLDALTTLVLIRSLNLDSFAVFVIYQSWVGVLLLFFPTLENILYREYGLLKDKKLLNREFAAFRTFNYAKLFLAAVLVLVFSFLPVANAQNGAVFSWQLKVSALALAFALPLSQALYGIYREPLRFELKQATIFSVTLLQKGTLLAVLFAVGWVSVGQIQSIAPAALAVFLVFGLVWAKAFHKMLPEFRPLALSFRQTWERIAESLRTVILWIHLNGAITVAIQTLDLYFLSRTSAPLKEVAIYSIALKAANFFQVLAIPVAQVFTVFLGRKAHEKHTAKEAKRYVLQMSAFFLGLAVLMWFAGYLLAIPALAFLAKGKFTAEELVRGRTYFLWQLAGIALYLQCFSTGAYLNNRGDIKRFCKVVFLPWLVFSAVCYAVASRFGVFYAAVANVPVYAFCALGHALFFILWVRKAPK